MGRSTSPAVLAAVDRVRDGEFVGEAAKAEGVNPMTLYAALGRLGVTSKRAWADPEVRAKMSAARKRALADPEVRAKMSAARKRALADPEVRAKMSAARKRAWADPEVRAKMSAARKRAWARMAVQEAALPLRRRIVDRARDLLDAGQGMEVAIDALRQEFGRVAT